MFGFAINDDPPLTSFAGIWTEFKGDLRAKSKPIWMRASWQEAKSVAAVVV
jgi:hypothetical protein